MKPELARTEAEQTCILCDGAGMLGDGDSAHTWKVRLCHGCNGHGVVCIETKQTRSWGEITKVHKYAPREDIPCEYIN